MPVKVTNNTKKAFGNIRNNVNQFIVGVGSIGATMSMSYAPLEFGDLRSSQRFDSGVDGSKYWASVSFGEGMSEPYPAILENKEGWKPRPPEMKSGPAWNPNARPHYLRDGFESSESKTQIEQLKKVLKV